VHISRPMLPTRRTRLLALAVVVLVVVGVGGWLDIEAGRYYLFEPGTAPLITTSATCRFSTHLDELALPAGTPCIRLEVPAGRIHPVEGKLLMVDVLVGQSTPWEYALSRVGLLHTFYPGSRLVTDSDVLGSAPASQLNCEDTEESVSATTAAPVAALSRLGYRVRAEQHGAQVFEVLPGSAAARAGVRCGDVITAVGGHRIRTVAQVTGVLSGLRPGDTVSVVVERTEADGRQERLTLHARLTGVPAIDGLKAQPDTAFLGVAIEDDTTYRLPFAVGADVGNIGGPSDGLAITLGLLDVLSNGRLTGGHVVAATGTITPGGRVGEIGGVAQKAVAVTRAGASLFLVPPANAATARRAVGPGVKVEAVSTLGQALADLEAIGGSVPSPSHSPGAI